MYKICRQYDRTQILCWYVIHSFERDQWSWEEAKEKGKCTHHKNQLLCMGDRGDDVASQMKTNMKDFYRSFNWNYFSFLHSSCLLPRRLHLWLCGQSSGEPRLPSASPPSMQLLPRGRPWLKPWRIWRSPNAALTTPALSGQLKDELSKHIWNFTREWHQRVTPESDTREWHQRVITEIDTRERNQRVTPWRRALLFTMFFISLIIQGSS